MSQTFQHVHIAKSSNPLIERNYLEARSKPTAASRTEQPNSLNGSLRQVADGHS